MEINDWSTIVCLITASFLFVVIRPSPRNRDENPDLYHHLGNLRIFVSNVGLMRKESAPIAGAHRLTATTKGTFLLGKNDGNLRKFLVESVSNAEASISEMDEPVTV